MAFLIKQGDLRPNLRAQLFQADGVTPLNITAALTVTLILREEGPITGPPKLRAEMNIIDAVNGIIEYDWVSGDTADEGDYQYEFEIGWSNGDPQTVPVDSYFTLTVVADLD